MNRRPRRALPALRPPSASYDFRKFPAVKLKTAQTPLFRAHRAEHDPWFFDHALGRFGGRFNLPSPAGTCYAASDLRTALRESLGAVLGGENVIEEDIAARRTVSTIGVAGTIRTADLNAPDAVAFGANRELSAGTDYPITQAWAATLAHAGFAALRYESRFTTRPDPAAVAIFGPIAEARLITKHADTIDGTRACVLSGIRILPAVLDDASAEVIPPPSTTTVPDTPQS